MIYIGLFLALLFVISTLFIGLYRKLALHLNLLDHPNHRSSHQIPTPRGAGLVIMLLWILVLFVLYEFGLLDAEQALIFSPLVLILLISFLDDYYNISARLRFLTQIAATILSLWLMGGVTELSLGSWHLHLNVFVGSGLALLMLLWSTNLFNFMDGVDGIAGLETLFVLLPASCWILFQDGLNLSLLMWALCSLTLGFLVWNWPKAKVFMGDCGSASIGFLIILFALLAQKFFAISILDWFVLYGLFLFDATVTLIRRIMNKEKWVQAHRSHAYQRLHQAGWSHAEVLIAVSIVNSLLLIIASIMNLYPQFSLVGVLLALGLLSLSYLGVERLKPMTFSPKQTT